MIQINNLSVFYKYQKERKKVLGPINFVSDDNDICAIIGPSGCGKTTLLNVLSGIIKNYEGEVLLNKKELNPRIHNIGFIPQNFGILPWKTVEENCLLPLKIRLCFKSMLKMDTFKYIGYNIDILMFRRL